MPVATGLHQDRPKGDGVVVKTVAKPMGNTMASLRKEAATCRRCDLWRNATRTVFGAGPAKAKLVLVGEQPGDQEDLAGQPFVGPAGRLLDVLLQEAGVDRKAAYVTNAVKHFKFEPRGKRRLHSKPNAGEVRACRWWLDRELGTIKPKMTVALGATAARSLLGKAMPIMKMRGQVVDRDDGLPVFLTVHPSFLLRLRDRDQAQAERARFLADMKQVARLLKAGA